MKNADPKIVVELHIASPKTRQYRKGVATVEPEAENETDSEAKTMLKTPSVYEVVPFDFSNLTNAPVTESEDIPATTNAPVTVAPEKTNKINSEEELVPLMPSVPKSAPYEETLPPTDAPVTVSVAASIATTIIVSKKTNEISSEEKPAPTTPPVSETAPSDVPKTNEDGVEKLALSVNETAPPEDISVLTDTPAATSAPVNDVATAETAAPINTTTIICSEEST
jgi:hypothetical protein